MLMHHGDVGPVMLVEHVHGDAHFHGIPPSFIVLTIFRRSTVAGKLGANPSGERLACPGRRG
jgi:hypothetical protein